MMSAIYDPNHPLFVPEENRKIARDRAQKYVDMISDYLQWLGIRRLREDDFLYFYDSGKIKFPIN